MLLAAGLIKPAIFALCIIRQDPNTEEAVNQILLTRLNILNRGCTDPERQVYRTSEIFTASLNI